MAKRLSFHRARHWYQSGSPWIWLNAGAVTLCVLMVFGLIAMIAVRGFGHFWTPALVEASYRDANSVNQRVMGAVLKREALSSPLLSLLGRDASNAERVLFQHANRDFNIKNQRWYWLDELSEFSSPADAAIIRRNTWGDFYGYIRAITVDEKSVVDHGAMDFSEQLTSRLLENKSLREQLVRWDISSLDADARAAIVEAVNREALLVESADGETRLIPLAEVTQLVWPNRMSWQARAQDYFQSAYRFVSGSPVDANRQGGIYPALFGTVVMVILMSVLVTPFGVLAAIFLHEYARRGWVVKMVRVSVYNLAGVPSIVYGIFGLGFFVYTLGGGIDRLFYADSLPAPVFGTPGLIWVSLTMALLTLPVVIVATEEGLSRIPVSIRHGSFALGATRSETLWKVVVPLATPAMMTGLILAVARAAGEVAPLMLVGVVKLAPDLPVDGQFPYVHLDQKIMHLGYHIYDTAFHSADSDSTRSLVYATSLLLLLLVVVLNMTAIKIRNNLRKKYASALE